VVGALRGTARHRPAAQRTGIASLLPETGSQKQKRRPLGGRRLR